VTKAIIFVPDGQFDPHASRCMQYCQQRGYEVEGVVRGDWEAAAGLLMDGAVHALVVSDPRHLDPHRRPRVEVVAEQDTAPGHRRTRIIRPAAAE
jgi:hypothetical protein